MKKILILSAALLFFTLPASHAGNVLGEIIENALDADGYNSHGYNRHGYNRHGYNKHGYNKHGYNKHGYNKHGYNRHGYNEHGSYLAEHDANLSTH